MNYSELLQLAKGWGNFISDRIIIWRLRLIYRNFFTGSIFVNTTRHKIIEISLHLFFCAYSAYSPYYIQPKCIAYFVICRVIVSSVTTTMMWCLVGDKYSSMLIQILSGQQTVALGDIR